LQELIDIHGGLVNDGIYDRRPEHGQFELDIRLKMLRSGPARVRKHQVATG
jgi:hypothetical protein